MLFKMWKNLISYILDDYTFYDLMIDFVAFITLIIFTPFILVGDILLSPLYLIAYIVSKYKNYKRKKDMLNRGFTYNRDEHGAYVVEYYTRRGK